MEFRLCCLCAVLCCGVLQVPPTMRFVMDGEMPEYLLAKDLILQVREQDVCWFTLGKSYQMCSSSRCFCHVADDQ